MGFLGLGSTITMLRMKYGSREAVGFTERVSRELALAGWEAGLELAEEKGPAPIMNEEFVGHAPRCCASAPRWRVTACKAGQKLPGRVLHAKYSRYMQRVAEVAPELVEKLAAKGARFTHHSSIAPTGTISLSLANNATNGIEPSFAHHYFRNVIREGRKTKEKIDVFSFELLAYRELINPKAMPNSEVAGEKLPDYFTTADDITPREHVDIQAAAQKWIDSSISKTANVPTDYQVRGLQGHLPLRARAGPQGLHDLPLQPRGVPGRAGQGRGPQEHDLRVHARRRHGGRGQGRRGDRVRRRDALAPPTCSTPSRKATTASSEGLPALISAGAHTEQRHDERIQDRQEDRQVPGGEARREGKGRGRGTGEGAGRRPEAPERHLDAREARASRRC